MEDRCVCCGAIIPEGSMVCINCVHAHTPKNKRNKSCYVAPILPSKSTSPKSTEDKFANNE